MTIQRFYHQAEPRMTECHDCGETRLCAVVISDPEPDTGYRDEYALCSDCKAVHDKRYLFA